MGNRFRNALKLVLCFSMLWLAYQIIPVSSLHAKADVAPPPPSRGSDLYPSIGNTNVRMMSEYVQLDVVRNSLYTDEFRFITSQVVVTAQFFMRNLGETTEQMQVRFPLKHNEYSLESELTNKEEWCVYDPINPPIEDIMVWVDDVRVEVTITYEQMQDSNWEGTPWISTYPCWAHFGVTFPPGQDVTIKVAYHAPGYSRDPASGEVEFGYVLGTGAGWKDTIGKALIIARFPYELNELNFLGCFPEDCEVSGKEIAWRYEDFEPEGMISFDIIQPSIWLRILSETETTRINPQDGEAWGRLGKAYKEAIMERRGFLYGTAGTQMYQLSQEAYQKALTLLPNDADWHYGYADLLCWNAEWSSYGEWNEEIFKSWRACFEQIKQTLDLDPGHERANTLLQRYAEWSRGIFKPLIFANLSGPQPDYLILTPQVFATYVSTLTPKPTWTPTRYRGKPNSTSTKITTKTPTATKTRRRTATTTPTPTYTETLQADTPVQPVTPPTAVRIIPSATASPASRSNGPCASPMIFVGAAFFLAVCMPVMLRTRSAPRNIH